MDRRTYNLTINIEKLYLKKAVTCLSSENYLINTKLGSSALPGRILDLGFMKIS